MFFVVATSSFNRTIVDRLEVEARTRSASSTLATVTTCLSQMHANSAAVRSTTPLSATRTPTALSLISLLVAQIDNDFAVTPEEP